MGRFLTIGYCLRTIGYFFLLFSENFLWGDKAQSAPPGKTLNPTSVPIYSFHLALFVKSYPM